MLENVHCHQTLVNLAESFGLQTATTKTVVSALNVPDDVDVLFLLSVPTTFKQLLLKTARLLLYTPENEHFGVVPLEAMLAGCPVLASNTGGPLETILDNETGWLRSVTDIPAWTTVIQHVLVDMTPSQRTVMSNQAKTRVREHFSQTKMAHDLDGVLVALTSPKASPRRSLASLHMLLACTLLVLADLIISYTRLGELWDPQIEKIAVPPFAVTLMVATGWSTYGTLALLGG